MTTADREELRAQLMRHEGVRLKPYRCTAGKLTLGAGRNIEDRGISMATAMQMLEEDLAENEAALYRVLPWFRYLDAVRQRALIDMAFMGIPRLLGFHQMLAALQRQDWSAAKRECLDSKWARDVGPTRAHRIARMLETGTAA